MPAQTHKRAPGEPEAVQFQAAVATFKLLADDTRLRILWALLHSEHSVSELADHVRARPPAVSQHLAKLRAAQLVTVRRDGNKIFYATNDQHVRLLVEAAILHTNTSPRTDPDEGAPYAHGGPHLLGDLLADPGTCYPARDTVEVFRGGVGRCSV